MNRQNTFVLKLRLKLSDHSKYWVKVMDLLAQLNN